MIKKYSNEIFHILRNDDIWFREAQKPMASLFILKFKHWHGMQKKKPKQSHKTVSECNILESFGNEEEEKHQQRKQ